LIAKRLEITGRVQDVGYRSWLVQLADGLGLSGWVRNRLDGSVEALIAGTAAAIDDCINACQSGPYFAVVDQITEHPAQPPEGQGFFVRPTA
jgi:acylphosphatase